MGDKVTHFKYAGANSFRQGGLKLSGNGNQPLPIARPTVWYPRNLPTASNGTPMDSDIKYLLNTLAPMVAELTVAQSAMLGACYRSVQSVAPGGTFAVNGVTSAAATFFDGNIQVKETVSVDVVNKNPALAYDLAVRLARGAAATFDIRFGSLYAGFTNTAQGTGGTTPGANNLSAATALLPVTGEPVLGFFTPYTYQALLPNLFQAGDLQVSGTSRPYRVIPCDGISVTGSATQTAHNLMVIPSALACCTADLGTATNTGASTSVISGIPGNVQIATSSFLDPETAVPQLVLQLVMGNSGSGNQTIYVNALMSALLLNPAGGVQVYG